MNKTARKATGLATAMLALAIAGGSMAQAVTVNNNFSRTCDQNRRNCSSWVQSNPPYNRSVGSTCRETDRQWGWAWVVATYTWTTPAGVRC